MGLNTAILLLNDAAHELENDPNAGKKLYDAMMSTRPGVCVGVALGNFCNAATVLPSQHADIIQLITVGGNTIEPLVGFLGHDGVSKLDVLRVLADDLGYSIRRKPRRTTDRHSYE